MTSPKVRIAYLKRLLKRLDGEEDRVVQLIKTRQLTPEGGRLTLEQLKKSRADLLSELRGLEGAC